MKIKHLVLGFALVAMMAACSKKAETTVSETAQTETTEAQVSETVETTAPEEEAKEEVKETKTTPTKKQETKNTSTQTAKVDDGCEAKISAFEKYAYDLQTAFEKKTTPAGLKALGTLVKDADAQKAAVASCKANYDSRYKTALLKINSVLTKARQ